MKRSVLFLIMIFLCFLAASCTKRQPEEVDYAPNLPFNPYPPDSATNIEHTTLAVTLQWSATDPNSGDVLNYSIFLDTLNPPLTSIASGLSSPSYFVDSLSYNTTYYWRLYLTDDKGATTSGPVWRFTTLPHPNRAPNVPTYLYPSDNSSWQYPTLNFGLTCTDPEGNSDTLYCDIYLGTTSQPPITLFKDYPVSLCEFTGLEYATKYYWKVMVRDNHYAYTSGPVFSFTTRDCPWHYKKELPSSRSRFGTAAVNNKIYVIGGHDGISDLAEVLEYDPLFDTWTSKAPMPTPRSDLAVTVWNNKIYALGGTIHDYPLTSNEEFDPQLNSWFSLAPIPISNVITSAQAINGKLYTVNPVLEYDIAQNKWWSYLHQIGFHPLVYETLYIRSTLPHSSRSLCSSVYNNLIYVMGVNSQLLSSVDIYNPETVSWSVAKPMIGPADFSAATTANGFIYVLGGNDGAFSKRVRKYDPISDTWYIRSDMQIARSMFGAAFANNCIYAIGGLNLFLLSEVEEYRLVEDSKNIPVR